MASKTEICNLALTRLSSDRVVNFDTDGTASANDCNAIYDLIAEEVMSMGEWPSVRRRTLLAQLTSTPAFEFTYAYQLPTDPKFLRILRLNEYKPGDIEFSIEGNQLLCNESTASIKYLALVTDTNQYDIDLRQAIVDRLVAELIYKKTGSIPAYSASLKYFNDHAKELLARASVGSQSSESINSDTFIDARNNIWPLDGRLR